MHCHSRKCIFWKCCLQNDQRFEHISLRWRHNERDSVSNHQPHGCLLNGLLRRRSKKTSKLLVTGLCVGNSPGPVNSPHKGPVTRKMFPCYDVIMFKFIFLNKNYNILTQISIKYVPKGPINKEQSLVKIMALCQTGDKLLSDPIIALFTYAYMHHPASMC